MYVIYDELGQFKKFLKIFLSKKVRSRSGTIILTGLPKSPGYDRI